MDIVFLRRTRPLSSHGVLPEWLILTTRKRAVAVQRLLICFGVAAWRKHRYSQIISGTAAGRGH